MHSSGLVEYMLFKKKNRTTQSFSLDFLSLKEKTMTSLYQSSTFEMQINV